MFRIFTLKRAAAAAAASAVAALKTAARAAQAFANSKLIFTRSPI